MCLFQVCFLYKVLFNLYIITDIQIKLGAKGQIIFMLTCIHISLDSRIQTEEEPVGGDQSMFPDVWEEGRVTIRGCGEPPEADALSQQQRRAQRR